MGVWTTRCDNGNSWWRDEFPDTDEGRKAAQADTCRKTQPGQSGPGGRNYDAPPGAPPSAGARAPQWDNVIGMLKADRRANGALINGVPNWMLIAGIWVIHKMRVI